MERPQPIDANRPREVVERAFVAFLGAEVEAGRVGVAGVEADPQRFAAARAVEQRRHVVEPAAEAAPLAGGHLQQQPHAQAARPFVHLGQRSGGRVDAVVPPGADVGARVQNHEVQAQLLRGQQLLDQRVAALIQDDRVAGGQVDEVGRVGHRRPPDGGVLAAEHRHLVGRQRPGAPLLRRAGEYLDRLAPIGTAPGDGVPGPSGDGLVGAKQHAENSSPSH